MTTPKIQAPSITQRRCPDALESHRLRGGRGLTGSAGHEPGRGDGSVESPSRTARGRAHRGDSPMLTTSRLVDFPYTRQKRQAQR
jgi:hypothetical protein